MLNQLVLGSCRIRDCVAVKLLLLRSFTRRPCVHLRMAESAINAAKRAAKGEIGKLGFMVSATFLFLPELVRSYKAQYPGVKLILQELSPFDQEVALDQGLIDIGFTRTLTAQRRKTLSSRSL